MLTPQRDPQARVGDCGEIYEIAPSEQAAAEGARCMDCGVAFCHAGCPLGNPIPDWNGLVYRGRWRAAIAQLHATNDFPGSWADLRGAVRGGVRAAIKDDAVAIKSIEVTIA